MYYHVVVWLKKMVMCVIICILILGVALNITSLEYGSYYLYIRCTYMKFGIKLRNMVHHELCNNHMVCAILNLLLSLSLQVISL